MPSLPNNIDVVTNPKDVARLLDPTPRPTQNIDPATGAAPGASVEEILAQIERDKAKQLISPTISKEPTSTQVPLQLKYSWTGVDDKGHPVKTLVVNAEDGDVHVVAFCLSCDKEVKSMKVAKLPEPEVESKPIHEFTGSPLDPDKIKEVSKRYD